MVSFVMLELEIITVTNLGTWADNHQPILYFFNNYIYFVFAKVRKFIRLQHLIQAMEPNIWWRQISTQRTWGYGDSFFHVVLDYLTTWGTSSIVLCTGQQEFCLSLLDGTLPPYHKSEPVPQEVSFIILFFCLDFEFFKRIYLDRIP